jgi:signal transduction protein with GAF and PtsI domain
MLVRSSSEEELESVCQKVIDLIVRNPETAFKAGVLRLVNTKTDGGKLEIVAKSFADGVSGERNDDPREPEDGIVGKVFQSKQPAILQNIRNTGTISKFRNRNWILENEFEAFGSFPVLVKGEPLGTLSLYTGYNYDFHPDSIAFVNSITNYIASYIYSVRLELLKARYKEALGTDSLNTPLKEEEKQFLAGTNESDGFSESAARDNHNELEKLIVYMTGSASLGGILGQLPGVVLGTLSGVLLWYFTVNAKRNAA